MVFIEEQNDLFNYDGEAWLVHCISADFEMGKGIAVEFNNRYNLKNYMLENVEKDLWLGKGYCIPVEKYSVLNLVTKKRYYGKPTYDTVRDALFDMKDYIKANHIFKIAMPTIASGLDGLQWHIISEMVQDIFKDTTVKIIVCKLKE